MASKRRIRKKECEGKIKHKSSSDAWASIRSLGYGNCHTYKCKFCGFFHVGHKTHKNKISEKRERTAHG